MLALWSDMYWVLTIKLSKWFKAVLKHFAVSLPIDLVVYVINRVVFSSSSCFTSRHCQSIYHGLLCRTFMQETDTDLWQCIRYSICLRHGQVSRVNTPLDITRGFFPVSPPSDIVRFNLLWLHYRDHFTEPSRILIDEMSTELSISFSLISVFIY